MVLSWISPLRPSTHWLAFLLAAMLAVELALVRKGLTADGLRVLGRVDTVYGTCAGLLVAVGVGRLLLGLKGWEFYVYNPTFWLKMTCFIAVGVLSSVPTVRILRWRRAGLALVPDSEIESVRSWLRAQAMVFALILVFAAAMARGY
jgi:putative membrane protein